MNSVQYLPPRRAALFLGGIVFLLYRLFRYDFLVSTDHAGTPVPMVLAIIFSMIVGYGAAMLGWLLWRTKGEIWATFRPTRARLIGAFCLAMVAPMAVFNGVPWILGGFLIFAIAGSPPLALALATIPMLVAYPFAAMIVHQTAGRRWLRVGLFSLCFWAAYSGHLLWSGLVRFTV